MQLSKEEKEIIFNVFKDIVYIDKKGQEFTFENSCLIPCFTYMILCVTFCKEAHITPKNTRTFMKNITVISSDRLFLDSLCELREEIIEETKTYGSPLWKALNRDVE